MSILVYFVEAILLDYTYYTGAKFQEDAQLAINLDKNYVFFICKRDIDEVEKIINTVYNIEIRFRDRFHIVAM